MSEQNFRKKLQSVMSRQFMTFDIFIIKKMGFQAEPDEKVRQKAFLEFRRRTNRVLIATMPTMRRWFGIGEFHAPTRESVIKMCFALSLKPEEAGEYLTKELGEPYFQINDYFETLFLYGLEHHLSYEKCLSMAAVFEGNMQEDISFSGTRSTKELMVSFSKNKELSKKQFLLWMADWFKGYSRTTLNYFIRFQRYVMGEVREEVKGRLKELLRETEYENWLKKHQAKGDEREAINRFIGRNSREKKKYNVSGSLEKCIRELLRLAYGKGELNTRMISEMFPIVEETSDVFRHFTTKYLSDLFHIPSKKEQAIRTAQALRVLENMGEQETCPDWIQKIGEEYTRGKGNFQSVEAARKSLLYFQKEHKRRCLLISRSGLLPLVLHVSQKEYGKENGDSYNREKAREYLCNMAEATLNACNMAALSEDYRLDKALLTCFQKDEMYSYAELLDAMQ